MDLLNTLRERIGRVREGEHTSGLRAVLKHIESATKHLERGQRDGDDTLFTDAIYRTNQAFEGSIKEAFRILAKKEPENVRPYEIERYLQENNVLRPRVLAQLSHYRKEWRNPSTHDYRIAFDDDEALLAIVTVTVFAIVLTDQVLEYLSAEQARLLAGRTPPRQTPIAESLLEQVALLLESFTVQFREAQQADGDLREVEILGALDGFLRGSAPDLIVNPHAMLAPILASDFLISSDTERMILEVKRGGRTRRHMDEAVQQVAMYMDVSGVHHAIVYIYNTPNSGHVTRTRARLPTNDQLLVVTVQ